MEVSVLIVEDEELYADKLEMLLDKCGYLHQATVDNSTAALAQVRQTQPDLILMDVNIAGEYDGIELADMIHKEMDIPILFITSLQDDMTFRRASRTNPVGFLEKPFTQTQMQRSIELVIRKLEVREEKKVNPEAEQNEVFSKDFFFIKNRNKLEKVRFADIVYLEADGRYSQVVTTEKKYLLRQSLQSLREQLGVHKFAQTHRSFAVNLDCVESVDTAEMVVMTTIGQIALSKRMKDDFLNLLEKM